MIYRQIFICCMQMIICKLQMAIRSVQMAHLDKAKLGERVKITLLGERVKITLYQRGKNYTVPKG